MSVLTELKREAYESNMEVPKQDLAIYTFGNVSAFDPDSGVFAIKPSGVPYADLSPRRMVVMDLEGTIVEGDMRPSSDASTHRVLYREFPAIRGITHTHSPYAVAWAQARMAIPIYGTTHADYCAADIPCTEVMKDDAIKGDYEIETGKQILETFAALNPQKIEMVLVACHGPFTWGKDAAKSVFNAKVLEEIAKMAYFTATIRPDTPRLKDALIDKHYQRKHGRNAYYGQT